jgi:hypothetical protein
MGRHVVYFLVLSHSYVGSQILVLTESLNAINQLTTVPANNVHSDVYKLITPTPSPKQLGNNQNDTRICPASSSAQGTRRVHHHARIDRQGGLRGEQGNQKVVTSFTRHQGLHLPACRKLHRLNSFHGVLIWFLIRTTWIIKRHGCDCFLGMQARS